MKKFITFLLILAVVVTGAFANGSSESSEGKTVVKVAHLYDPMGDVTAELGYNWFKEMEKAFEAENPDIDIQTESFAWDQIDVKMMQDYKAGVTAHDVFMSTPQIYALHNEVGDAEDLLPFIKRDWSDDEFESLGWSSTFKQGLVDGKQIALPMGTHVRICAYNKDMFEAAGLDPNTPPATLEEVIEYAKKLTVDVDGDGNIDQWGLALGLGPDRGTIELTFMPILWNYGGDLWDAETKSATISTPEAIKTLELIWDLVNTYKVVDPAATVKDINGAISDMFTQDRAAIALGWGSYWAGALEELGYMKGVIPPKTDAELTRVGFFDYPTTAKSGFANSWSISMYKNSQNKEAAWRFLNFMFHSESLDSFPDAGLPIRAEAWDKPEYKTEYYDTFKHAIEIGHAMPVSPYYGELADTVAAAISKALQSERAEIPAILENAQNEFNSKYAGK